MVSVMRQRKFCNVEERNEVAVECAVEKYSRKEKNSKLAMHQERTKTQNCTRIANTIIIENTCEYDGYVYMMIIIIGLLWAKKKCSTKSKPR